MQKHILKKENRGITLIALVITIIVLLILAGVAIASLAGDNGILKRAGDAKEDTAEAQAKEEIQLAILESMAEKNGYDKADIISKLTTLGATVTENGDTLTVEYKGYKFKVDAKGTVTKEDTNTASLPSTEETTPWLPTGATQVAGTDLTTGLSVTKGETEWTWVVVPKTITASAANDTAIETALRTYCTNNGVSNTKKPNLTDDLPYTYTDEWYSKAQSGMNQTDYNSKKSTMLNSIKNNGGFWIGKYEVGYTEDSASNYSSTSRVAKIIQNAYPYTYVTCSQAEGITESLTSGLGGTGSLMFGLQWDLTLVYLKLNAGVDPNNSTRWGNHRDKTLTINSDSAYRSTNGRTWSSIAKDATSKENLLTTGAAEDTTNKLNIVDLAGNVSEFTLEKSSYTRGPCVDRGAYFGNYGDRSNFPASYRGDYSTSDSFWTTGFRPALY